MMEQKDKTKRFIEKAKEIHGGKYDYSKSKYKNKTTKLIIICPEHGKFEQTPRHHIDRGQGCKKCSIVRTSSKQTKTINEFIKDSKKVHGNKYDYSKVEYKGDKKPITIICPEHGEFEQLPTNHLKGRGCKYCGGTSSMDRNLFIYKAKQIHGDKYDYSKAKYNKSSDKITIICPEHGEFEQTPNNHLSKNRGCPYCNNTVFDTYSFIEKAKSIYGNEYNYSKSIYKGLHNEITIICPEHGEITITPHYHLNYNGCKKCSGSISKIEKEVTDFIKFNNFNIEENSKNILTNNELDIYIPDKQIAIEFNGLYWHSEIFKDKNYHLNKTKACEEQRIQLIHIFEDEWVNKPEVVKSMLLNKLDLTPNKIYGRKCSIKEITTSEAREFCEQNHLQGYVGSSVKLGLFYGDELISVMTFGKLRKPLNSSNKNNEYELLRFCNKLYTNVIGGANKLFKHFVKNYKPNTITSYADKRYSKGKLYKELGFKYIHDSKPNYFYFNNHYKKREHRFNYRKDKLVREGFDPNKSEHEIMLERGIYRIYDCGNKKYEWNRF